jgi:hypothetical protein
MKGLMYIPTLNDLQKAYQKVQINPRKISTDEWVLWSQWSRFDARLASN